jgi:serine/threonine protein phosphatase PrpC
MISQPSFKIKSFAISDKGLIRKKNEDSYGILEKHNFFSLADGLGGRNAGDVASSNTIKFLSQNVESNSILNNSELSNEKVLHFLLGSISDTNHKIFQMSQRNAEFEGMGTTLTCALFFDKKCIYGNIGDSRLYRFRENILTQITKDDTLLAELLHFGFIEEQEAKIFPLRHVITKSIGSVDFVDPTFGIEDVEIGDYYLLCSDGLHGLVSYEKIKAVFSEAISLEDKGRKLLSNALEAGGSDNITLILLEIEN